MMPEILLGRTSHPALERGRIRGDDLVHVGIERARRLDGDRLEVHHEPSVGLPKGAGEDERGLEAQGEHGGAARRLRVAAEEGHPRGRQPDGPLVDEEGDPDEANQLRLFEQMLGTPTRTPGRPARKRTEKETVWARYHRLKENTSGLRVDPVYEPFLTSVLKYLAGETQGLVK